MINLKPPFKFGGENGKKPNRISKDPVCGMRPTEGIDFIHENIKYSFCSEHCKQQFEKKPEAYITK